MTKVGPSLQHRSRCYHNKSSEYSLNMIAFICLLAASSLLPTWVHEDNPPNSNQILKDFALKPTITKPLTAPNKLLRFI